MRLKTNKILIFLVLLAFIYCLKKSYTISTSIEHKIRENPNEIDSRQTLSFVSLLILIVTGPKNIERRHAVRKSWIYDALKIDNLKDKIDYKFVIGTKGLSDDDKRLLLDEENTHKDLLLLENLHDSYNNLTLKLAMMLENVNLMNSYEFILKVDDDSFVRVKNVLSDLEHLDGFSEMIYKGFFYGRGNVKTKGPWKELNWKICDYYLPYARGGGYIISKKVVDFVARNWKNFQFYLSEDVSLGAWLAPLKINRIHDYRFDTEYKTRGCSNTFLISHKQSIQDLMEKSTNLRTINVMCKREFSLFNGYDYNWEVKPSKCCVRNASIP